MSANNYQESLQISLNSSDDKTFHITYGEGKVSKLVENTMDNDIHIRNDHRETNNNNNVILLPKVHSETLSQIVRFMRYHKDEPLLPISSPFKSCSLEDVITQEWYISFINSMDRKKLFQLINGANYMDIEPLLNLGCLAVSAQMMGKSAEEIRVMLNIGKMDEDEELRAKDEHSWMF
mmetsp:Transcript_14853/g.22506  ORF Transcript_14853/g.22506 Transcript_14853/m.22506 type:complete len:178 (+) Transcript_14853:207-740(+)